MIDYQKLKEELNTFIKEYTHNKYLYPCSVTIEFNDKYFLKFYLHFLSDYDAIYIVIKPSTSELLEELICDKTCSIEEIKNTDNFISFIQKEIEEYEQF